MAGIYVLWLLFWQICIVTTSTELLILHSSDTRGRFDQTTRKTAGYCSEILDKQYQCMGGLSRTIAAIKEYRNKYPGLRPKVLYFFSGNLFTGSIYFRIFKANISAAFMNLLAPDAVNLGKTEFHYGHEVLHEYIVGVNYPVVATNLDLSHARLKRDKILEYKIIRVGNLKIGVMGFVCQTMGARYASTHVRITGHEHIAEVSRELHRVGVHYIILLSSDSYDTELMFASTVPYLDLVIGGGDQVFLWNKNVEAPPEATRITDNYPRVVKTNAVGRKERLIVRTLAYARYLGKLNITLDAKGNVLSYNGLPIYLEADSPKDPVAEQLLQVYAPRVKVEARTIIAKSKVYLEGGDRECYSRECNIGNVIADAFVDYATNAMNADPMWTYVAQGVLHAGMVRTSYDPLLSNQTLSRAALMEILPFSDLLCIIRLTGAQFMRALQYSTSANKKIGRGDYLQVSGVHLEVDASRMLGDRVVGVKMLCANCPVPRYEPLKLNKTYNIVTSYFVLRHFYHGMIQKLIGTNFYGLKVEDFTVIESYFQKLNNVNPIIEGRIKVSQSLKLSAGRAKRPFKMLCLLVGVLLLVI